MDENALKELLDILNKKEGHKIEDANADYSWLFALLFVVMLFGYSPTDKTKESYLQGKLDAYEKILGGNENA